MTGEMGCEQIRELAPELALGIAAGEDRDAALRHLGGCPACRQLVAELSSVGDELLLLAPAREPPPGFQSRVLDAIAEPPSPRALHALRRGALTRGRRWAAVAAAAVLVAALGAGSVFAATAKDRQLAESYRAVLSEGQGSAFAAAPLQGPRGRVGTVFGYQGQPPWMVVTVQPSTPDTGQLQVQAVTRDGRYLALGKAVLGAGNRAWGGQIPVNLSDVQALRFVRSDGQTAFSATFNGVKPWD
jgi:anti-sigma factor RsiW